MAGGLQAFFGDGWEDAIDSLKSAPGALGGLMLSGLRQVRPIEFVAFSAVVAGWAWVLAGVFIDDVQLQAWQVALGLAPTVLWLGCGLLAALIFEIGGIGLPVLVYWEAYALMLVFAIFGPVSLRIALSPESRQIHRGAGPA